MVLAGLGDAGCRGIYHDSSKIFPADPDARQKLRIDQAYQAEKRAEQAVAHLRDRFAKGLPGAQLAQDVDRLELAAREFDRCVTAISDSTGNWKEASQFEAEARRLQQRAAGLLKVIEQIRNDGLPSSLPQLDRLFPNPDRTGLQNSL
jgi:hypothetical protein